MNFNAFTEASLAIQIHIIVALLAFTLGVIIFSRKKGTKFHKAIGKVFLVLMLLTAGSSFFIREINQGQLSFIHIFIPITLFASVEAVYFVRKGNIKRHKRAVQGMFFGALLIPGFLSFLPGRLMSVLVFGG